ncbi:L,D-transpeptidase family protein [Sphingomonas sp. SM33]|uniref:L,D-transpeptidase family protein n=1 Tax=Sphingomonas telluris TaxID=2907998 RepID=A0ABS9VNU1_9SPHN|nr:L,D-transpeptidase family protein [Sphingomonas telluris]MCH8616648.1 L,D-transpeptidase family protein [Sphingomonas telluris]
MKRLALVLACTASAALLTAPASAQEVARGDRPILTVGSQLKNGEYVWAPELSPTGPALFVVNLETQRAVLFRNGVPIAATTISSGKAGNETPTGVFTILQKRKEHYSKTYNNAPMPNMQRLTWSGIALHAGKLPGYPASHGCIRLPHAFSTLLFGATEMGMTVVITSIPAVPSGSDAPALATMAAATPTVPLSNAPYEWHPERSPAHEDSIVSVVISVADGKAVVMRNGIEIGSAPVRVTGETRPMAYVLRAWDSTGRHWLKLQFAGAGESMEVDQSEAKRFEAPEKFRYDVGAALRPGSVIIVTPESLHAGSTGRSQTVLEEDMPPR